MTASIRHLKSVDETQLHALTQVVLDCVEGGGSVGFMQPLLPDRARGFWRGVAASVERGERALLVAEDESGTIVGTVQVVLAQPENQPHRAEISKLLVHRRARREGLGAALMSAAEQVAIEESRTLLVLDTASADAERVYERLGWQRCGVIPGYALWPDGGLCATTIFFKTIGSPAL
jgi:GNAT superfamily N-acetyltransferase